MIYRKYDLNKFFPHLSQWESKASLTIYMREKSYETSIETKRPCVLICPGGAYSYICEREAEPIALRLIGAGINAAVLRYSTAANGAGWPKQLIEVSAAMAFLRRNAKKWDNDPGKLAVMGFSAGGHVAGSLGIYWSAPQISDALEITCGENKPNAMVLCYPVITSGEYRHAESISNLLGDNESIELIEKVSLEKHVTHLTPPAFIWHTKEDTSVSYFNSVLMENALRNQGIPCELHLFEKGVHGLALADETTAGREEHIQPSVSVWFTLFKKWIYTI